MKKSRQAPETMHEVRPGQSIELLKELHILTRDGKMNQDSRRKLKQIFHLMQFIEPLLQEIRQSCPDIQLVDHGAGKSYLGFILYDLFFKTTSPGGHVFSIERRMELVERSRALAERLDSVVTRYGATRRDSEFA
ncbi:MAG TPA: SAM-dependent methyltransferase, partial [Rhodocyclaceae bacterium]|nr:SAM-dependent methyltransferase [Rhodocyclaceae bacterium]